MLAVLTAKFHCFYNNACVVNPAKIDRNLYLKSPKRLAGWEF